ncbi:uncharacterized protein H6S33_004591 [Morchella sextelata]|uniref:uncharacterized protein n=1 Tax=Morchella sextelata TaxID=1174677 RepID=UPI001D05689A|nr:uncharacterized protein H6S33_004591 [Morchella sextelata]KAH0605369.1 hypothetical protein H6S33_004591 [Morchella sextelata]
MALAAYRHLLRAARTAFEGDTSVLTAASSAARQGFETNRDLPRDSDVAQELVKNAEEVATMLRKNVVQGRLNGDGRYELRIHDEIERGDNESIKQARETLGAGAGKGKGCCSA